MWRIHLSAYVLVLLTIAISAGPAAAQAGDKKPVTLDTDPNLVGWWKFRRDRGHYRRGFEQAQARWHTQGRLDIRQGLHARQGGQCYPS